MRLAFTGLAALLATSAVAEPASAQLVTRVQVGAGLAHTLGAFRQDYRTGLLGGAAIEFTRETTPIGLRLSGAFQRSLANATAFPGGGKFLGFSAAADVVVEPQAGNFLAVAPYGFAGAVLYRNQTSASTLAGTPPLTTVSDTRYGVHGGAGLLLAAGDNTHIFIEAGFEHAFSGTADAAGNPDALNSIRLQLGVRWRI